jgi:hypothetical protein
MTGLKLTRCVQEYERFREYPRPLQGTPGTKAGSGDEDGIASDGIAAWEPKNESQPAASVTAITK